MDILNLLSGDFSLRREADRVATECGVEVRDGGVSRRLVVLSLNYEKPNKTKEDIGTCPDDDGFRFIVSPDLGFFLLETDN